jgi:hypothetical protein
LSDETRPLPPINLQVVLPAGAVMIPSWLALVFVASFMFSAVALLLVWNGYRESNRQLLGEVRVLQLYVGDVENVLIRQGVAKRSDFASKTQQRKETK